MTNEEYQVWRTEKLAQLPPQDQETIPPLLFIEIVPVTSINHTKPPTGFQDSDLLAREIRYVTEWPETPGGRWSDMGEY